jgi:hypothetical protein
MGNGKTRFYKGADLAPGTKIKLNISGITASAEAAATAAPVEGTRASGAAVAGGESGQAAKVVAGAGGLMIFVVGGFLLFLKAPKSSKKARA